MVDCGFVVFANDVDTKFLVGRDIAKMNGAALSGNVPRYLHF